MNWTTPADLKKQLERLWKKGTHSQYPYQQNLFVSAHAHPAHRDCGETQENQAGLSVGMSGETEKRAGNISADYFG
ncbi:hypothetical protein [Acetobacter malorum]|uniref:hypothetical protein n=1 Tax=Acetobacter malorum TaxID=178901 RepID=UPI0011782FA6|nr:hypothetical protein [Acetobacter malorum]